MAISLGELVDPARCAVLTSECQRGIVGDRSPVPMLADVVRAEGTLAKIGELLHGARRSGVPVLHCVVHRRRDGGGSSANCRLLALGKKGEEGGLRPGSDAAALVPELGPAPGDYFVPRLHGVSPFGGTELDAILRNLGVRTVIATGVSLNVALLGLTIEAVNLGYQVVLPRDATAGLPPDYVDQLLQNTLSLLATVTTTAAVLAAWNGEPVTGSPRP